MATTAVVKKWTPLAVQEIAAHGGMTHMSVITADDLNETTANTTQAVKAGIIPEDGFIHKLEMRVAKPFRDKSDRAFNSLTATVGDTQAADTFLAAKQIGGNAGRAYNDAVTNETATVTSATATFVAGDVGKRITGAGIPDNTFVGVRNSATSIGLSSSATANVPVAATATATGVTITILDRASTPAATPNFLMNTATGPYTAEDNVIVLFTGLPTSKSLTDIDEGELHIFAQILDPKWLSLAHGTAALSN